MNKEFKKMIKELNDGKNLEERLPEYSKEVSSVLNDYAYLQLALEYYGLKEYIQDEISDNKDTYEETKQVLTRLNELVKECVVDRKMITDRDACIERLDGLRNEVMEKMDVLTAYVDEFRIYEYVLNRLELSFADQYEELDEEMFMQQLSYYLFGTKDTIVVNSRIQEMVGQLPVRMLKAKFFDLVRKSMERYKDTDVESLETFEYMLRTNSMLYSPDKAEVHFEGLRKIAEELKNQNYKELEKTTYQKLCTVLMDSSVYINQVSDIYVSIQKVINSLYIYALTLPYAMDNTETVQSVCTKIIAEVNGCFGKPFSEDENEKLYDLLNQIVGKQEVCYEKYMALEGVLYDAMKQHADLIDSLTLRPQYECLLLGSKLCNTSVFVDIHKEASEEKVSEEDLEGRIQALLEDLERLFKEQPQCMNRAVMASVLSTLPVFFTDSNEVIEYAKSSLEQCKNVGEKTVAMRLLLNEMTE